MGALQALRRLVTYRRADATHRFDLGLGGHPWLRFVADRDWKGGELRRGELRLTWSFGPVPRRKRRHHAAEQDAA